MLIRSFQKRDIRRKRIFGAIRTGLFILLGWIVYTSIRNYYYQQSILPSQNLKIGQSMSFEGDIENTNNFPIYTHTIYNNARIKIYAKSSSINLNEYKGQSVGIKGTITDIYKGTPLVDISEIKIPDAGLTLKDNQYIFSKDFLVLDFKNQNQLSAKRTEREIDVYYGEKKIFSIERFVCSDIYKTGDCTQTMDEYEKEGKDTFTSYQGYTYYKHGTGLRTLFDGTKFGYIFKNIEQSTLLDISSNIKFLDAINIMDIEEDQIKESCQFEDILAGMVTNKEKNQLFAEFDGQQANGTKNTCKVIFDTEKQWEIVDTEKQ